MRLGGRIGQVKLDRVEHHRAAEILLPSGRQVQTGAGQGDLDRVNVDPAAAPSLFLKWGRDKMVEPTYTDLPGI